MKLCYQLTFNLSQLFELKKSIIVGGQKSVLGQNVNLRKVWPSSVEHKVIFATNFEFKSTDLYRLGDISETSISVPIYNAKGWIWQSVRNCPW
jgi:hypothetical protein